MGATKNKAGRASVQTEGGNKADYGCEAKQGNKNISSKDHVRKTMVATRNKAVAS